MFWLPKTQLQTHLLFSIQSVLFAKKNITQILIYNSKTQIDIISEILETDYYENFPINIILRNLSLRKFEQLNLNIIKSLHTYKGFYGPLFMGPIYIWAHIVIILRFCTFVLPEFGAAHLGKYFNLTEDQNEIILPSKLCFYDQ